MLSLRLKMLGLVAGTVGAAAFLTSAAAVRSQIQSSYSLIERTACDRALDATLALSQPITSGDESAIREALENQLVHVGADRALVVLHKNQNVIYSDLPPEVIACRPVTVFTSWSDIIGSRLVGLIAMTVRQPVVSYPVNDAANAAVGKVTFDLDLSPARTEAVRSVGDSLAVGVTVVSLAVVVAFIGIGRITVPLGKLRNAASAIAQGNLDTRLDSDGEREVDELCRTFNEMTDILASHSSTARFLSSVMDSMADSLIVVDTQAKVLSANRAAIQLLGYTEGDLKGRTASLFCEADGHPLTAPQLEAFLGSSVKEDHEVTFIAKDGRRIPISFSGSPIKDVAGAVTAYVCIGTDISARRAAESERDKMNKQLLVSSREAGMAVVATGVLHNVGNVLNSVNVSASMVETGLKRSKVPTLVELSDLIQNHKTDLATFMTEDERGRVIPDYLGKLAKHMSDEQDRLLSEISSLTRHVSHIKDIISVQQSTATAAGLVEAIDIRTVIEDAILVITPSATRHHAQVTRDFSEVPQIVTDRHKLLQIIVNLLSNAIDAVKEVAAVRTGVINIAIRPEVGDRIAIAVTDNGVGISAENLTKIFAHGFTTKKGGHGFGLHSSALAAAELKGSLGARSEGLRTGATFTLIIPVSPAAAMPATPAQPEEIAA